MTVRNYTTKIAVDKTILEIENILVKFGAKGIYKEYDGSHVSGIMFFILKDNQKIPFKIPIQLTKARTIIINAVNEGRLQKKYLEEPLRTDQAERVVFRIIRDWIHSQLSLIEINFADTTEIFLPYIFDAVENKTLYQKFLEKKESFIALEQKKGDE